MELYNYKIYDYAQKLNTFFDTLEQKNQYLDIKTIYILKKNAELINDAAKTIEDTKVLLIKKYAQVHDDGSYEFNTKELEDKANAEYNELMHMKEKLPIRELCIEDIQDIKLTPEQFDAIGFMLIEKKEAKHE